jgi:hypothetical protein
VRCCIHGKGDFQVNLPVLQKGRKGRQRNVGFYRKAERAVAESQSNKPLLLFATIRYASNNRGAEAAMAYLRLWAVVQVHWIGVAPVRTMRSPVVV